MLGLKTLLFNNPPKMMHWPWRWVEWLLWIRPCLFPYSVIRCCRCKPNTDLDRRLSNVC